ncbi:MAG TPA: hypothetical protein VHT91_45565 [Kofleriaceae bacterium]|nr:hypothetical protein [Kofleriaceae bacterium]
MAALISNLVGVVLVLRSAPSPRTVQGIAEDHHRRAVRAVLLDELAGQLGAVLRPAGCGWAQQLEHRLRIRDRHAEHTEHGDQAALDLVQAPRLAEVLVLVVGEPDVADVLDLVLIGERLVLRRHPLDEQVLHAHGAERHQDARRPAVVVAAHFAAGAILGDQRGVRDRVARVIALELDRSAAARAAERLGQGALAGRFERT